MATTLSIEEAKKLIRVIQDGRNPAAAAQALALRDKWLLEYEWGVLRMDDPAVHALRDLALEE
jgi:very-short-patch-repair endonuclease